MQNLQHLINGLTLGCLYALIALGYTMVYGVLKFINFAHGEILMVGVYAGLTMTGWMGGLGLGTMGSFVVGMVWAMLVAAVVGMTIERLAYRPLRKAERLAPLLSAIGVSIILVNIAALMFGTRPIKYDYPFDNTPLDLGGLSLAPNQILNMVVSVVLMVALRIFIDKTRLGKAMRATSQDLDTARLMGVNGDMIISLTFALGSALAAVAGVLIALEYKAYPTIGTLVGLKAFIAAVVGGIGNIGGAMLGGLLMGLLETLGVGVLGIPSSMKDTIAFGMLILVLLVRPAGILGKQTREKV